jgi:hypothetical protein
MRTIQVYLFMRSNQGKKVLDLVTRVNGEDSYAGIVLVGARVLPLPLTLCGRKDDEPSNEQK